MSRKFATEVLLGLLDQDELSPQAMRAIMGPSQHSTAISLARFLNEEGLVQLRTVRGKKRETEYRVRLTNDGVELARALRRAERVLQRRP